MPTRMFAFLRAINTGGRRLTNDQLLAPFATAGLDDVRAYQAAGNVGFVTDQDPADLEPELSVRLAEAYGFDTPVFIRTADQLRVRLASLPFTDDEIAATEGRTQITFMASKPGPTQVDEALALVPSEDRVVFVEREWLWLPRGGISTSDLPVGRIEQIVGTMTMRTVGTVQRMLAKLA